MQQRLKSALRILEQPGILPLVEYFLWVNSLRPRFDALLVAVLDARENQLDCYYSPSNHYEHPWFELAPLKLKSDDLSHPLAQVLLNGQSAVWQNLCRGVRIEHSEFREFVSQLPNECGLYALPLFNHHLKVCGVIAVFAKNITLFTDNRGMFNIYVQLFQYQLCHLHELKQSCLQLQQLRSILSGLREKQQQLEQLLDELNLSRETDNTYPRVNFSDITDINQALSEYELAILRHRFQQYGEDRQKVADSLGIAKRALDYKLSKYRGLI